MKYYPIDERLARSAHECNFSRDYRENETTEQYRHYVDIAAEAAEDQKAKHPELAEKIDGMLDRYARQLAEWYDENSRIEAMCPSVMISGASNFPVHKKEKQNRRRDAHMEKWNALKEIVDRIKDLGNSCRVASNDENVIETLEKQLAARESEQEMMKSANAYYRKNKTLDGCPVLTTEQAEQISKVMARLPRSNSKPFEDYELTSNNASIRRIRERVAKLKAVKESGTTETESTEVKGVKIVVNTEAMRIQLIFYGKPDEEVRNILKHRGFRWSPRFGAWQRELTENGKYAVDQVLKKIKALDAE